MTKLEEVVGKWNVNNYRGKAKTLEQECRIEPCTFILPGEPQNYAGSYIEGRTGEQ
jgi:hypothetical protein